MFIVEQYMSFTNGLHSEGWWRRWGAVAVGMVACGCLRITTFRIIVTIIAILVLIVIGITVQITLRIITLKIFDRNIEHGVEAWRLRVLLG